MPPPLRALGCALAALMLLASSAARADALRKVERSISSDEDASGERRRGSSGTYTASATYVDAGGQTDDQTDGDQHCDAFCLVFYNVFRALSAPWSIPRRYDIPWIEGYAPYPFADGPALLRTSIYMDGTQPRTARHVALDLSAESGFLLEGVVPATIALRAHLPARFELSATMSLLSDVAARDVERATMASAHLLFRHAQTRRAELRTGIGARLYVGDVVQAGVDVLYGIDFYFRRRGVLRVDLHGGTLGQAFVGQARASVGVMVRRTELYAGYDHTAFFGGTASRLGGPIAGVRRWF